jgi:hypothetical protein
MGLKTFSRSPQVIAAEDGIEAVARKRDATEAEIYAAFGRLVTAVLRQPGRVAARRALNAEFNHVVAR